MMGVTRQATICKKGAHGVHNILPSLSVPREDRAQRFTPRQLWDSEGMQFDFGPLNGF